MAHGIAGQVYRHEENLVKRIPAGIFPPSMRFSDTSLHGEQQSEQCIEMILEGIMKPENRPRPASDSRSAKSDDNIVERTAKRIVPPGTDVDNKDIEDPGRMTPDE